MLSRIFIKAKRTTAWLSNDQLRAYSKFGSEKYLSEKVPQFFHIGNLLLQNGTIPEHEWKVITQHLEQEKLSLEKPSPFYQIIRISGISLGVYFFTVVVGTAIYVATRQLIEKTKKFLED
jgi:hypothetical protein